MKVGKISGSRSNRIFKPLLGTAVIWTCWLMVTGMVAGSSIGADKLASSWYLRMGQWHADIRTLAACASYVVRGDSIDVSSDLVVF